MNEHPDSPNRSSTARDLLDLLEGVVELGGEILGFILEGLSSFGP